MKAVLFFFLLVVALILAAILVPIGFIVGVVRSSIKIKLADYLFRFCIGIDQLGNVGCSDLFNLILIMPSAKDKFGNPDETISSVLGKNYQTKKLTWLGMGLNNFLNKLEKEHTIKAIEET